MADLIYRGQTGSIQTNQLTLSGKDGASNTIISSPSGLAWQAKGLRDEFITLSAGIDAEKSSSGAVLYIGTASTVPVNLPEAGVDGGLNYTSIAAGGGTIQMNPVAGENIIYSGGSMTNGEYLAVTDGKLKLVSDGSGSWIAALESGTLAEETP